MIPPVLSSRRHRLRRLRLKTLERDLLCRSTQITSTRLTNFIRTTIHIGIPNSGRRTKHIRQHNYNLHNTHRSKTFDAITLKYRATLLKSIITYYKDAGDDGEHGRDHQGGSSLRTRHQWGEYRDPYPVHGGGSLRSGKANEGAAAGVEGYTQLIG